MGRGSGAGTLPDPGLEDVFRVIAPDYEGHVTGAPKPDTLTPANVAADVLAVADAAGADRFACYGYSWLAVVGLQLAVRTGRLSALVMDGGVHLSLAGPILGRRAELEGLGWDVRVMDGLDHTQAMQAARVVPLLRPWLTSRLDPAHEDSADAPSG